MNSTQASFIEKIWSKFLHLHFRMTRGLTLGVRAVVINVNGEVLLVRHRYTDGWHFPGGGVEPNETVERALARELKEETGLTLVGRPMLNGVFFNHAVSKRDHVLVYLCDTAGEVSTRSHNPEIADVGFFDLGQLPNEIDLGTKHRLEEITEQKQTAKEW